MSNPKRPRDTNQLAKLIVDLATGEKEERTELNGNEHPFTIRARAGGLKGGKARAEKLTVQQKKEIALNAAKKRWNT